MSRDWCRYRSVELWFPSQSLQIWLSSNNVLFMTCHQEFVAKFILLLVFIRYLIPILFGKNASKHFSMVGLGVSGWHWTPLKILLIDRASLLRKSRAPLSCDEDVLNKVRSWMRMPGTLHHVDCYLVISLRRWLDPDPKPTIVGARNIRLHAHQRLWREILGTQDV